MSIAIGGGGGLTLLTTRAVTATVYDPVTRGNTEFDGKLFYEILPDIYRLLSDYDLLPRIWEGYAELMCDLLLALVCADSSRSLLDVPVDYQRKYQHIDLWFENALVNDPLLTYSGKGSVNFPYAPAAQALDATWTTKLSSDRGGVSLRSDFDERAMVRWSWRATYTKFDGGSYGFLGYYNSEATALENSLLVGIGRGGRVGILHVTPGGNPNMAETSIVVPLDTEVDVDVEYDGSSHTVTVTVTNVATETVLLDAYEYSLSSGPSSEEFSADSFGLVNLDISATDFSVVPGLVPVSGDSVKGTVTFYGYLDPSLDTIVQAVPSLQDEWRDPSIFWEDNYDYDYHDYFFAFSEQPEDFLLAEYVSYNRELIKNNFGLNVGLSGDNTSTYRSQVQALHSVYWKGPTMQGIRLGTQVLLGLPFAEEAGEVLSVNTALTGDLGEIVVQGKTGKRAYQYPNTVASAVTVGDTVVKFEPLTEGVEVKDWKNDPEWFKPFLGADVPAQTFFEQLLRLYTPVTAPTIELHKYHMFMVSVHVSLLQTDTLEFETETLTSLLDFFDAIKQTWKSIVFNIFAELTDDVSPDDEIEIVLTAPLWDHGGSSAILAPHYGAPGGPPYDYVYDGPPPITYGMYHPSFPDDPIEVRLTNIDPSNPHTITINGVPVIVDPLQTVIENIP